MEVKKTFLETEFELLNVPSYDDVSLCDMHYPRHIKMNKTYYKLTSNKLVAFRVLAMCFCTEHLTTCRARRVSFLVQTPNSKPIWFSNYITPKDIIFETKEDYFSYLLGEKTELKYEYSSTMWKLCDLCPNLTRNGFHIYESWTFDNIKMSPKRTSTKIKYFLILENEIHICLDHCTNFHTMEQCIANKLNDFIIDDFNEEPLKLEITILPNEQKIRKLHIVEI